MQVPPASPEVDLRLRVADRELRWREGEVIVFDDSFDHEVWFEQKRGEKSKSEV